MIPKGMFSQIAMILLAVAIVFTYVKPEFIEMNKTQEEIALYKKEREMVISVNSQLAELVSRMEQSVSNEDRRKLQTYLPDNIDQLSISRDMTIITQEAGVLFNNITFDDLDKSKKQVVESDFLPIPHNFTLSVEGTYEEIRRMFELMAENDYPLEIQELMIEETEGFVLSAEVGFVTYSFNNAIINNEVSS